MKCPQLYFEEKEARMMAGKLSKQERKALIQEAEKKRAEHPAKKTESGFATIDKEAEKLENEH